ncbi:UNVERIFIED_CONTAM: hypothetical protein FKN15_060638 [Acipenser sinensis]
MEQWSKVLWTVDGWTMTPVPSASTNYKNYKKTSSLVASTAGAVIEPEKGKFPIWPEWNEADINAEKWEGAKVSKDRDKSGKSPSLNFFEDPEGKIELPPSVKIHSWKRPSEFLTMSDKALVIVENECWFDFISANEHLVGSELLRLIISEINIVWKICNGNLPSEKTGVTDPSSLSWKPWEHIYALCKAGKGQVPLYNIFGKYVVKLFWMGCWRKITVDDTVPFDEENNMLLPATTCRTELWPLLLSKAIIKLANVEVGYLDKVWNLLKDIVPKFQFQDQESSETKSPSTDSKLKDSRANEVKSETPPANKTSEKYSKDAGKKKGKDVEKKLHSARPSSEAQNALHHSVCETLKIQFRVECRMQPIAWRSLVRVQAIPLATVDRSSQVAPHNWPSTARVGEGLCLPECPRFTAHQRPLWTAQAPAGLPADSSEKLRHYGLSHAYSHPVLVTRTRSCPLVAPTKPPPIPRWKLIRPKRHTNPTDEPKEPVIVKPDQFVEIASPFLNYRLNPIHITSEHELHSSSIRKELGSPSLTSFTETDHESDNNIDSAKESLKPEEELDTTESLLTDLKPKRYIVFNNSSVHVLCFIVPVIFSYQTEHVASEAVHMSEEVAVSSYVIDKSQEDVHSEKPISRETWIDFDDFCKCFQTLLVYHKPNTYSNSFQKSDFKLQDEKCSSHYLFVDNLKPTEILISFSALVHWGDVGFQTKGKHEKDLCCPLVLQVWWPRCGSAVRKMTDWQEHVSEDAYSSLHFSSRQGVAAVNWDANNNWAFQTMQKTGESICFTEQALVIVKAIGNVINNFSDENELPQAQKEMELAHCPPQLHSTGMIKGHFKAFNKALYYTITKALGSTITSEDIFAIRALIYDVTIDRDSKEHLSSGPGPRTEEPESWINREPTLEETQAVTKLQAGWKGCYVRKIKQASKPDGSVCPLYHSWLSELSITQISKICADREVFHVPEDMLVIPKVSCSIPVCILHVVNNDTGEEVPRVFQKVEPRVYPKNINGYTFVAEAHSGDLLLPAGKWKLRLIGSYNPLPVLGRETVNNNFSIKEMHKYVIQATVLHKSWTLNESELAYVQVLKEAEKNDIKVHGEKREEATTPVSVESPHIDSQKPAATPPKSSSKKGREKPVEKSEKDKPSKDREKIVPLSPSLDASKPNWTLRVVSDQNDAEAIEVKKDTERVDEIRALKQAWETAEPGRAIKAMQSRLQYINKYLKKIYPEPSAEGGKDITAAAPDGGIYAPMCLDEKLAHLQKSISTKTCNHPQKIAPCWKLKATVHFINVAVNYNDNYFPTFRKSLPEAVLKDEFITEQQQKEKSEEIHQFRQFRESVMERREQEMQSRNILKKRQLEMYEQLQIILDEKRQRILTCREAYRSKLLEAEHKMKEEAAALEAAHQAALAKHSPPPKQKGKSAGKKK